MKNQQALNAITRTKTEPIPAFWFARRLQPPKSVSLGKNLLPGHHQVDGMVMAGHALSILQFTVCEVETRTVLLQNG